MRPQRRRIRKPISSFSCFFDRNTSFAVSDFQQSAREFKEGEIERSRYLLILSRPVIFGPERVCFMPRLEFRRA